MSYSAGYEFPSKQDRGEDRAAEASPDWDPGSDNSLAHGCICRNGHAFPGLGHQLATRCTVHVNVTWELRVPRPEGCTACDCDPMACGCDANERDGRV